MQVDLLSRLISIRTDKYYINRIEGSHGSLDLELTPCFVGLRDAVDP